MRRFFLSLTIILFCCAGSFGLRADTLFDNGAPEIRGGFEITNWIIADQFAIKSTSVIQSVTFWK